MTVQIPTKPLKEFAQTRLRLGSPLREVLLGEPKEFLGPEEFLARLALYLRLAEMEQRSGFVPKES